MNIFWINLSLINISHDNKDDDDNFLGEKAAFILAVYQPRLENRAFHLQ